MTASNQIGNGSYPIRTGTRIRERGGIPAIIVRLLEVLISNQDRLRQRRHLRRLDDRLLRDIGLTREDVCRETGKPWWCG